MFPEGVRNAFEDKFPQWRCVSFIQDKKKTAEKRQMPPVAVPKTKTPETHEWVDNTYRQANPDLCYADFWD
jgi:hypothetical protein